MRKILEANGFTHKPGDTCPCQDRHPYFRNPAFPRHRIDVKPTIFRIINDNRLVYRWSSGSEMEKALKETGLWQTNQANN